jgi:hypothetical protein
VDDELDAFAFLSLGVSSDAFVLSLIPVLKLIDGERGAGVGESVTREWERSANLHPTHSRRVTARRKVAIKSKFVIYCRFA